LGDYLQFDRSEKVLCNTNDFKYITSGGLAFSEEKDMKKMQRYSRKDWHVRDFAFMGYTLEKGEEKEYIYSVDYRNLTEGEEEEYFDFFDASGWSHVVSQGNIHLFRAEPGTVPIYSDKETTKVKYANSSKSIVPFTLLIIFITILSWWGASFFSGWFQSVSSAVTWIAIILALPLSMTMAAVSYNEWSAHDKKGILHLGKMIFSLIIFAGIIMFLFRNSSGEVLRIALSMLIGGITIPTLIWAGMSLYHRVGVKKGKR
jgi:hypothetical protein